MTASPSASAPGVVHAPAGSQVRSAGTHAFRVRGDDESVAAADTVFATLDLVAADDPRPVHEYFLTRAPDGLITVIGAGETTVRDDLGACLDLVQWHLNQAVVDGVSDRQTAIHAAAATRDGCLLVLPAPTASGKSTLVAGLVRAGWDYLTDEVAVVDDATGRTVPYPKPISIDAGAWPLFPQETAALRSAQTCLVPVPRLGGVIGPGGAISLVVSPFYSAGSTTQLDQLAPAAAVLLLAQSTFLFDRAGPRHLRALADLARQVPCWRLVVGDLDHAVAAIDRLAREVAV